MKNLILIVEDDKDLSHLLGLYLRSKGFNTICVDSIKETESFLTHENPTMMLLDNHLNDGAGIDHIQNFKTRSPGIPIVMMTADYIQDIKKSQHYNSLDGILYKPFSPDSLNSILQSIA